MVVVMGMVVVMEGYGSDDGDDSDSVGKHGGGDGNDGRMRWFVMVILEVMGRGMVIMMVLIVMIGIREVMVWVGGSPPATLSLPKGLRGPLRREEEYTPLQVGPYLPGRTPSPGPQVEQELCASQLGPM